MAHERPKYMARERSLNSVATSINDEDCKRLEHVRIDRELRIDRFEKSLPRRYRQATLDSFRCDIERQHRVVAMLREYLSNPMANFHEGIGIVLYGPVGTGKDHLAIGVMRVLVEKLSGVRVLNVNCQDWFGQLRDAIDQKSESESQMIRRLSAPHWLLLSDPLPPFGNLSQHQSTMLYRLLEQRAKQRLPNIVTINVANEEEARTRLGAACWDRMRGETWRIQCKWESYRRPARELNFDS